MYDHLIYLLIVFNSYVMIKLFSLVYYRLNNYVTNIFNFCHMHYVGATKIIYFDNEK